MKTQWRLILHMQFDLIRLVVKKPDCTTLALFCTAVPVRPMSPSAVAELAMTRKLARIDAVSPSTSTMWSDDM